MVKHCKEILFAMPFFPYCCKYFSVTLSIPYNTSFEVLKREAETYSKVQTAK